jgi:Tfp pilus assembly protein PilO
VSVDKADRFWPDVTRLVVAILIVFLILAGIGMYFASQTFMSGPG